MGIGELEEGGFVLGDGEGGECLVGVVKGGDWYFEGKEELWGMVMKGVG